MRLTALCRKRLLKCNFGVVSIRSNVTSQEYLSEPNYPPILTPEEKCPTFIAKTKWHDKITRVGTYEQKVGIFLITNLFKFNLK